MLKTIITLSLALSSLSAFAETREFTCFERIGMRNRGTDFSATVKGDETGALSMDITICNLWHGDCIGDEHEIAGETFAVTQVENGFRGENVSLLRNAEGKFELAVNLPDRTKGHLFTADKCK
ncbi:MAG: hypothetical protein ACXVBE_13280 [Bdellovibrionota bacterium]